ncbi:MAG: Rap1a/Tai family immunity protein [Betaproteobacteria bacterium]
MTKSSVIGVLAAGLLFTGCLMAPVFAGDAYPTGLDLIKRCNALNVMQDANATPDQETVQDFGYCIGFIVGYVSGFAGRDATGEAGRFCPSADVKITDFVASVQAWLVQHPEALDKLGAYVMTQALRSSFPCSAK